MPEQLQEAVLALVEQSGATGGVTMGKLVDRLVDDGADEQAVELMVWELIRRRELTPNGFVCRKVRNASGEQRSYEFVLIPWSPALDAQLELDLGESDELRDAGGNRG
ncbi:hypothetical protein G6O69_36250 [Pseudenhygromyxa sp. WMMC2535]|uniref:hypothetical protein n=1 Tax=Pseudenhygromyxa sp. WMMC2535 TaxID=2712867 RepID=UPI001555545D|nr:hypothetical protein [Pseudenhygromyxa sp. WMMC2535]NVB43334.1 hypothetical protein [Pseudenhygromyxa sp. WMMC2535]